ncbi:hypothetical protein [Rummeliibacillus suwonensis]|uniref:hypothetical protein n=1 Tax=Rummeliibacillus suwonensis TaxID=1306154 RepID=UPI001AAF56A5|nr:hypothetical protein [Rummeliibacillus suwonensis]MBO2535216.1 hypothetical protein [Rummeliibacillus suwonensis]
MKNRLIKSIVSLGVAASIVGSLATVSHASIAWDSDATYTGSGGKANVYAYTSQKNESANYKITVVARTNDGSSSNKTKNPASSTDTAYVNFTTKGAISSGSSDHEWVMKGESGNVHKAMDIH